MLLGTPQGQANQLVSDNTQNQTIKSNRLRLYGQEKIVYMTKGDNETKEAVVAPGSWCVMRHLNPKWIERILQKDSRGQFRKEDEEPQPPYRFFVPYQTMPRVIADRRPQGETSVGHDYDPLDDEGGLRDDFRNFVFIQAPAERVEAIVSSDWNKDTRLSMSFYCNADASRIWIDDDEMHRLILTLQDRQLKFYLDNPLDDFAVGDKVILQMSPWTGKMAEVKKIAVRDNRVKLTVGLNIFGRMKSITFPDIGFDDVEFVDRERGRLLNGNPILNYEEEIIDLLSRRYSQKISTEMAELDDRRLMRLATYTNIYIEDPDEQARFAALKLICACLRTDKGRKERYTGEVEKLLGPELTALDAQPSSFIEAYLMMALFIATRNPSYRDAVKDYRHAHPDCPDILRRYHSIVKGLRPKKPRKWQTHCETK